MISMAMLHDAQRVLKPVINRTPVIQTKGIVPGCDFYLKADCLQKTGAFKLRGAYYKIATLSDEEKERGVIACSAGNHAQGVAYAARDMGIRATICIPEGAPLSKIEATRSYGANVVLVPGVYDDAYALPDSGGNLINVAGRMWLYVGFFPFLFLRNPIPDEGNQEPKPVDLWGLNP